MPEPTISYPGRDALRISAAKARENANGADVARAALAALDAQAHDLAALVARLDAIEAPAAIIRPALSQMLTEADEPDGPPCAACGLPDSAHLLDPDHAEDWQPQHRYIEPDPTVPRDWPVIPLPAGYPDATTLATCGACGRSWDDDIITSMTPAPSARCPFEAFHEDGGPPPVDRVALADTIHGEPTGADFETGRDLARMAEVDGAVSDGADVPYLIAHAIAAARAEGYQAGYDAGRLTSGSLPR